MAKHGNPFEQIRFVYKRSSRLTKIVVLCTIVLSTVTLLTIQSQLQSAQAQKDFLQNQAAQLEQENNQLKENIDDLGSVDSVEQIAKDELGLVNPDTVIMAPNKDGSINKDPGDPQSPVLMWIFCIVAVGIAVLVSILVIGKKHQRNPKFAVSRN